MSEIDLPNLQSILTQYAPQGRSALLPALQAAQSIYGYISEETARQIGLSLKTPLADIQGVIDFYGMLYDKPTGKTILRVCTDPACAMKQAEDVLAAACQSTGCSPDCTSQDGRFTVEKVTCLGLCEHAPAALINEQSHGNLDQNSIQEAILGAPPASLPVRVYGDLQILTGRCRSGRSTNLEEYRAAAGYRALEKALRMNPLRVIEEVKQSGLVGRGGAAFPTGLKWEGAAQAQGSRRYVVCNADESEPGTFKDRILLEGDPHLMLEGLMLAGYAVGAQKGYIYLRGEYPTAFHSVQAALSEAREAGLLGTNLLNSGWDFDIELCQGAGAYICGEETALFESIEGKRGFPRLKPPFPTTHGLFGMPTSINNVETLCNVPFILLQGAEAYRKIGTQKSPGPKLFCVSGDVARPGVYEVPFGVTLRHVLDDLSGGVSGGYGLKAILLGGAAGAFATPDQLDVPLSFENLKEAGLPLGSGVIMVFNESRDLRDVLLRLSRFFAHESCGKCYPCQIGTRRQYEIIQRIAVDKTLPGDQQRLLDIGMTMTDASICGLGQTAASAVLSAIKIWPEYFKEVQG